MSVDEGARDQGLRLGKSTAWSAGDPGCAVRLALLRNPVRKALVLLNVVSGGRNMLRASDRPGIDSMGQSRNGTRLGLPIRVRFRLLDLGLGAWRDF